MLQLTNGCACSEPSVFPKNWKTVTASVKQPWRLQYYFYDPVFKDTDKYPYFVIIKGGINRFHTLPERREAVHLLLSELKYALEVEGYNPITGISIKPQEAHYEIAPTTPLLLALEAAKKRLKCAPSTLSDIASVLKGLEVAAQGLNYARLAITDISRKHIVAMFYYLSEHNKKFSDKRQNKYRAYLLMLFKELKKTETISVNPLQEIEKEKVIKSEPRQILTDKERILVNNHLYKTQYNFWRLTQIFFHSGGRETELLSVQGKNVDLQNQTYKVLVKKGKEYRWVIKIIKDIALPLWIELMKSCSVEDYLFSKELVPGIKQIRTDQITRRWHRHVKMKLGITSDFYSLKHLNTTETVEFLSDEDAAKMNAHASTAMVVNIYDVNRSARQNERLKKINNKFA